MTGATTLPDARDLSGRVAVVSGATRGAGRGIAVELGAAGATVYVTGRTTATTASPMNRPETIEETAALVDAAGGDAIPLRVDHSRIEDVRALIDRVDREHGRLDLLVNNVWGGDPLTQWGVPFWKHDLANGIQLLHNAVDTHLITSWHAAPLMRQSPGGLIVEVTDGIRPAYRGSLFYDLAKASVIRAALAQSEELRGDGIAVIALSPGFLRSEAMLEGFGSSESTWRDAVAKDPNFAFSETPRYIGRAVVALASDPHKMDRSGTATATWELYEPYGFTDVDGTQPDWGQHARDALGWDD